MLGLCGLPVRPDWFALRRGFQLCFVFCWRGRFACSGRSLLALLPYTMVSYPLIVACCGWGHCFSVPPQGAPGGRHVRLPRFGPGYLQRRPGVLRFHSDRVIGMPVEGIRFA